MRFFINICLCGMILLLTGCQIRLARHSDFGSSTKLPKISSYVSNFDGTANQALCKDGNYIGRNINNMKHLIGFNLGMDVKESPNGHVYIAYQHYRDDVTMMNSATGIKTMELTLLEFDFYTDPSGTIQKCACFEIVKERYYENP